MFASVKVGSVFHVQLSSTEKVFTNDTTIIQFIVTNGNLTATALKVGSAEVIYENANGLRVEGTVNVTGT